MARRAGEVPRPAYRVQRGRYLAAVERSYREGFSQMNKHIHVMHALPAMSMGLAAMLCSQEWEVSLHVDHPEGLASADVVIVDYETGLKLAGEPRGGQRQVLIVTHRDKEADIRRALDTYVGGYLREDTGVSQLRHAVRYLLTGARYLCPEVLAPLSRGDKLERLTNRESEVLRLLAKGLCNKSIARDLGIGLGTVKFHVRSVMGKLQVSARTQAVIVAAQRGLVGIDQAIRV